MKRTLILISIMAFIGNCASGTQFAKGAVYNPDTSKVVSMAVFDMSTNETADLKDESNKIFDSISQSQVGNIYGNIIPGGELTVKAAEKLGIKKDLDKATGKLTQAIVNSNSVDAETTKIFSKIANKIGVEALAFPLVSGNKEGMTDGTGVVYRFVVYDVRNPGIQYVAQTKPVTVSPLLYDKADEKQKKSLISAAATSAIDDLFSVVKKELEKSKK